MRALVNIFVLIVIAWVFILLPGCHKRVEAVDERFRATSAPARELPVRSPDSPRLPERPILVQHLHQLASEQVVPACELLKADELQDIIGESVRIFDHSEYRRESVPVESSCLYGYGAAAMHQEVILSLEYIRLDVYSERAMQEQGWGALADYWRSRLNSRKEGAPEFPGGLVEWVDSEHPPDPSLLIKLGDVMLEVGHWPPGSWPPSSERNRPIELAARHAFERIIHLAGQDSGSSGEG